MSAELSFDSGDRVNIEIIGKHHFTHPHVKKNPKTGKLAPNMLAVVAFLDCHPSWSTTLRYNEFLERIETCAASPLGTPPPGGVIPWVDDHENVINMWFEEHYGVTPKSGVILNAATHVAFRHTYHPVKEYLAGRRGTWDGVKRFDTFVTDYLGATEGSPEYRRELGRALLIAAVGRAFRPGCKADKVVVLEGPQGTYKSTFIQVLYRGWTTDSDIDLTSKDKYMSLQGNWAVELSEIDRYTRHEAGILKGFITSATDKYRPPYGRAVVNVGRQSICVGTTNRSVWMNDPTGGRRFDICKVGYIDIEKLKRDRDQIWAEAVTLFDAGELTFTKDKIVQGEQADIAHSRTAEEVWTHRIAEWIEKVKAVQNKDTKAKSKGQETLEFDVGDLTMDMIWTGALGKNIADLETGDRTRIGNVMHELEWRRVQVMKNGTRYYVYRHEVK